MYKEELKNVALQNGAVETDWRSIIFKDDTLIAYYPDGEAYPEFTEYAIDYREDGAWIIAHDIWPEGSIQTDWATLFPIG